MDLKGTQLTQRRSRPVRYEGAQTWIVRDNHRKPWGPFETPSAARAWAQKKWPDIPEYPETEGTAGYWDLEALWTPLI